VISDNFNNSAQRSPFKNAGVYFANSAITTKVDAKFLGSKSILGDVLVNENDVPDEYWLSEDSIGKWKTLKDAKKDERFHKSGAKYYYSEGKMAFPDAIDSPSRTILTAEGGSSPSRFKHVIEGSRGLRRLVPVELERLNGFRSNWTEKDCNGATVPDTKRAFLMGNALVIPLIERVGKVLAKDIVKEKNG
jgi:DNA (cytosine-5)-methyltransferase 1